MTSDLRAHPPRRPSAAVDGVVWLPRLIDKARAYDAATLGDYLFGQSPVDARVLRAAGIDYTTFLHCTRKHATDSDVLAAIDERAPGARERLRAWTLRPGLLERITFALVDADEGYGHGAARAMAWIPPGLYRVAVTMLRRLTPLRVS